MATTRQELRELLAKRDVTISYWTSLLNAYENIFYLNDGDILMLYAKLEFLRLWNNQFGNKYWVKEPCSRDDLCPVGKEIYNRAEEIAKKRDAAAVTPLRHKFEHIHLVVQPVAA